MAILKRRIHSETQRGLTVGRNPGEFKDNKQEDGLRWRNLTEIITEILRLLGERRERKLTIEDALLVPQARPKIPGIPTYTCIPGAIPGVYLVYTWGHSTLLGGYTWGHRYTWLYLGPQHVAREDDLDTRGCCKCKMRRLLCPRLAHEEVSMERECCRRQRRILVYLVGSLFVPRQLNSGGEQSASPGAEMKATTTPAAAKFINPMGLAGYETE